MRISRVLIAGIAFGVGLMAIAHTAAAHLEQSAVQQCLHQDWPAAKHAAMTTWCNDFMATRAKYGAY